jgi:hypothetical protein
MRSIVRRFNFIVGRIVVTAGPLVYVIGKCGAVLGVVLCLE